MILHHLRRALPWILILGVAGGIAVGLATGHAFRPSRLPGPLAPGFLALAVFLAFVPWCTDTLRLRLWARVLGHEIRGPAALRVVVGTELGSAATPTAVGGLPVKVALLADEGLPAGRGLTLSMLKSLEDAVFFALALPLVFLLVGPARPDHLAQVVTGWGEGLRGPALGAAGVLGVALLLLIWRRVSSGDRGERRGVSGRVQARWHRAPRLRRTVREMRRSWSLLRSAPGGMVALSLGLTALQWGARYSALTALVWGLGIPADPLLFWLLQWVVFTSMTLVPTPGAAGGAEVIFALVYGPLLPGTAVGLLVMGWRALTFHLLLLVGVVVFTLLQARVGRRSRQALLTPTGPPA
jgi:uncharacterized protein (TIRG00374 family)